MCYDPKAEENSPPLWEYENKSFENVTVPAGYKVRVIGATVRFTWELAGIFQLVQGLSRDQPTR